MKTKPKLTSRICRHCGREYIHDANHFDWRTKLCSIDCKIIVGDKQERVMDALFDRELNDLDSPYRNQPEIELDCLT